MKKTTVGRPKLPKGEAKSLMLRARVSPEEFHAVERAAKDAGKPLAEWIRKRLLNDVSTHVA